MIDNIMRQTIITLHQTGKSQRAISRLLKISRHSIKKVLAEGREQNQPEPESDSTYLIPLIKNIFKHVDGNIVRVREILKSEYGKEIAYSTLTRLIRQAELHEAPKRYGEYIFEPGEEMQHDTSPHRLIINGKTIKAQCAGLIFAFSRKLYFQYYPRFTRFEAKAFLVDALNFMGGSCMRCVVDNTSVILASGSGANAIFAPEMVNFARMFGFEWMAHAVGNPNRKGRIERPFSYIEKNFLAGRTFQDWKDLNSQAIEWCNTVANQKIKRILGKNPETAFIQEKPYLQLLPEVLPPVYEHCIRTVDSQGYINLDSNRYSVPEKLINKQMDVYKYLTEIHIYYKRQEIAKHIRITDQSNVQQKIEGHHPKKHRQLIRQKKNQTEDALLGRHEMLDAYVAELKNRPQGRGIRSLARLLQLKQTYPQEAFIAAVTRAHTYNLYDLSRLEELILKHIAGNFFNIPVNEE